MLANKSYHVNLTLVEVLAVLTFWIVIEKGKQCYPFWIDHRKRLAVLSILNTLLKKGQQCYQFLIGHRKRLAVLSIWTRHH